MQGCQLVDSHKSAGSGPVRSPASCPSKKQNQKPNHKQKKTSKQTKNKHKKHATTTKTKQKQHREVGSQPALRIICMMTSCVSLENGLRTRSKTQKTQKHTKGPGKRVKEATSISRTGQRDLLAPDTWNCKRAQISLKPTIDAPLLGTIIEQNGDGLLEQAGHCIWELSDKAVPTGTQPYRSLMIAR